MRNLSQGFLGAYSFLNAALSKVRVTSCFKDDLHVCINRLFLTFFYQVGSFLSLFFWGIYPWGHPRGGMHFPSMNFKYGRFAFSGSRSRLFLCWYFTHLFVVYHHFMSYVTLSVPCHLSEFYPKRSSPLGFWESNFRCTCPMPNVSHYYVANSLCSIN